MPNIRERNDTALDIRPTEVGIEATAAAARRSGAFYNQAAGAMDATGHRIGSAIAAAGEVAVKYEDHRQISLGAKTLSETQLRLDQEWDDLKKHGGPNGGPIDPNDPSIAAKFREERVEPALEQFKSGFTTERSQQWAEHHVEQYRSHMVHKTTADMGSLAASAVHLNAVTTENNQATRAYNDPSALDDALSTYRGSIGGIVDSSPTIKAEVGAKVKSELMLKAEERIVKAAAMGAIAKGGDWQKITERYPQYVNGAELRQFEQAERGYKRAERADEANVRHLEDIHKRKVSEDAENEYLKGIFSGDPKTQSAVTAKGIAMDDRLTVPTKKNMIHLIERESKPETETKISNSTMIGILGKLRPGAREIDDAAILQEIWDARLKDPGTAGSLTEAHFEKLRKEVIDRKTPEGMALSADRNQFLSTFGAAIDGGMTGNSHSALGRQQMAAAQGELLEREQALRAGGINPRELYRRGSEHYFDKDGSGAAKYGVSMQQTLNYWASIGQKAGQSGQGLSPSDPIVLPKGTTPKQVEELGLKSGMWFIAPGETKPRQLK